MFITLTAFRWIIPGRKKKFSNLHIHCNSIVMIKAEIVTVTLFQRVVTFYSVLFSCCIVLQTVGGAFNFRYGKFRFPVVLLETGKYL